MVKEIYKIYTCWLAVLIGLELVWPGIVLAYININLLLIFWLAGGIVLLLKNNAHNV